jgi:regulator of replication initiation timing
MNEPIYWVAVAGFLIMALLSAYQNKLMREMVNEYGNLVDEFTNLTMENIILRNKLEDIKDERDSEYSDWRSVEDRR